MEKHILITDSRSLLRSFDIQIVHKHPDYSHRIRSDLDLEELVAASYPILLANKIIPFLEYSTVTEANDAPSPSHLRQTTRQPSISPTRRRARRDNTAHKPLPTQSPSPTRPTLPDFHTQDTTQSTQLPPTTIPTPLATPTRQLLPPQILHPTTINTTYTSRTTSPNGTLLSPIKSIPDTPWPSQTIPHTQNPTTIPSALFTPAPPRVLPSAQKRRSRGPPSIIEFDIEPRRLLYDPPRMTLTLRHNVSTRGLSDVFEWCRRCIELGRMVTLEGWLVRFRDTMRVREIMEVCAVLGLEKMRVLSMELLYGLEDVRCALPGPVLESKSDVVDLVGGLVEEEE